MFGPDYSAGILPGTTGNADPGAAGVAGSTGTASGSGAGRLGFQTASEGGMGDNPVVLAWSWLNTPFQTPLSATDVFLLIGIVLVSIMLWNLILYHVRIAAETI
jgi:uncharacterized membrane protein YgdD (TMEM256/DUF423 family)